MTTDVPAWRRSSRCSTTTCVEVAKVGGRYLIRDSKNLDAAALSFTEAEWLDFRDGIAAGEFRVG